MNDLDLCLEVVSSSCQPWRYIFDVDYLGNRQRQRLGSKGQLIGNERWGIKPVIQNGQTHDPNTLRAQYLENGWR